MSARCIIAIDGPAGSGKSTVAVALARRLGYALLDTGAMYRAAALAVLEEGGDPLDQQACTEIATRHQVEYDASCAPPRVRLDGRDVTDAIRDPQVSAASSPVSAAPGVRTMLVEAQRGFARSHPYLVTEGRDQGTVVFPDAEVKVFLVARPDIRARRRTAELRAKGQVVEEAEVLRGICERDQRDSTRAVSPLREAAGSLHVDSSDIGVEEVVAIILRHLPAPALAALSAHASR